LLYIWLAHALSGIFVGSIQALGVWSLALIGNASDKTLRRKIMRTRGVFDKETRRKPLVFAADAVRYGI
jgi:hypothetical protein